MELNQTRSLTMARWYVERSVVVRHAYHGRNHNGDAGNDLLVAKRDDAVVEARSKDGRVAVQRSHGFLRGSAEPFAGIAVDDIEVLGEEADNEGKRRVRSRGAEYRLLLGG